LHSSLWAHPKSSVSLICFQPVGYSKTDMLRGVLQLAQCNTVVHTIDLLRPCKRLRNSFRILSASTRDESQLFLKINAKLLRERIFPFVAVFSDEHCTSSPAIPIYCFDFCRRMSQRLFARTKWSYSLRRRKAQQFRSDEDGLLFPSG
jgi:hypothetical protein